MTVVGYSGLFFYKDGIFIHLKKVKVPSFTSVRHCEEHSDVAISKGKWNNPQFFILRVVLVRSKDPHVASLLRMTYRGWWGNGDWFYKVREDDILPYKLLIGDFFWGIRWLFIRLEKPRTGQYAVFVN
jgi:hypothetical protein